MTPGEFQRQKYDYIQRDICIDHLAAPIEQGRCPSPYCGINVDSAEDDKPIVEVQDANLGISYRFDPAKFTPEKAQEWVQKRTHKDCPVCSCIEEVGLLTAAQHLYKQYGADVLEVIEGHQLPPHKRLCRKNNDADRGVNGQCYRRQQSSNRKPSSTSGNFSIFIVTLFFE